MVVIRSIGLKVRPGLKARPDRQMCVRFAARPTLLKRVIAVNVAFLSLVSFRL